MEDFYFEEHWEKVLDEQKKILRYKSFTREKALELGLLIIEIAKTKYKDAVAIRILEDETVIFSYKMPGTSSENDWWMDRKYATFRKSGLSSFETFVKVHVKKINPFWEDRIDNFAICGGCTPIILEDGTKSPYTLLVSGLPHHLDHQIMMDAMARQIQVEIPSLI